MLVAMGREVPPGGLLALQEPARERLIGHTVDRGEARTTKPAGLVGINQS